MIGVEECRRAEIEERAIRIAGIDGEVPEAGIPIERTIEIGCCQISLILPVEQYVVEVSVAIFPIRAIQVVGRIDADEIIKVYLVSSLILVVGEVQLVSHLVGKEQSLLSCLVITHTFDSDRHGEQ